MPVIITLNIGTAHYHKGKESDNVFMMSDYTSFFTDMSYALLIRSLVLMTGLIIL